MNFKRRIFFGLLFLLGISLLVMMMSAYYNRKLAKNSEDILKDNFNSVVYAQKMLQSFSYKKDSLVIDFNSFQKNLLLQQNNITERGEKETTDSVATFFNSLPISTNKNRVVKSITPLLVRIMSVNLMAIEQKNTQAQQTSKEVFIYLLVAGMLFLLLAIPFVIRFPNYIVVPMLKRDKDKTNLIATVSHELKTPIASIMLSTKLLNDERVGNLNEEQKDLIKHINEETDKLMKITGEVLSMGQMEEGKIQLNLKPVPPFQIIQYVVDSIKIQAEEKNIIIKTSIEKNIPHIFADEEKTTWVLINILNNATRYSPEKSEIIVTASSEGKSVKFSVKDFGSGISDSYKEKIFDKYFQIPGNSKKGSGLGLAIAKEFIELQHGKIWVESKLREGSTFCFTLPLLKQTI